MAMGTTMSQNSNTVTLNGAAGVIYGDTAFAVTMSNENN